MGHGSMAMESRTLFMAVPKSVFEGRCGQIDKSPFTDRLEPKVK